MKNVYICILMSLCWIAGACSDKEDTTPSMADENRLEALLDQSNTDIVEFKEKYGTYILYEFDDLLDFAYQFEEASAWREAVITKLDKEDVPNAVSFLKTNFLTCYNEQIMKEYFPRKLLICSKIYGATLGVSQVTTRSYHSATANMNSVAFAGLDRNTLSGLTDAQKKSYLQQLHFVYLAGYVINARTHYFVDNAYFSYCSTLYNSLMDSNRTQAKDLSDEFFYEKGFFRPDIESDTYFRTAEDDLIAYTKNLILMDQDTHDIIQHHEIMESKMRLVAQGLKNMGVQVEQINPLIGDFLD